MKRRHFLLTGAAAAACALTTPAQARSALFATRTGVALNGYDPVTYFTQGGPRPGHRDMALYWKGAVWQFATARHRALFEANPWPLAPRFGAYCAQAMTRNRLVPGDPLTWYVNDGRLYVMSTPMARDVWMKDISANVALASANWPQILRR